jgi:hypothetical protein
MSKRFIIILLLFIKIIPIVNGQELFPFRKDSLWGFFDANKTLVIPTNHNDFNDRIVMLIDPKTYKKILF